MPRSIRKRQGSLPDREAIARRYTRPSILSQIRRLQPGDHLCLLYRSREEQLAWVIPFLAEGLKRGEPCLCLADETTAGQIGEGLKGAGVALEALPKDQFQVLSQREIYLREGRFDPEAVIARLQEKAASALKAGYAALRLTAEMGWLLASPEDGSRLLEYEAGLSHFTSQHAVLALCQYPESKFDTQRRLEVISAHPRVIWGEDILENFYALPSEKPETRKGAPELLYQTMLFHLMEKKRLTQQLATVEGRIQDDRLALLNLVEDLTASERAVRAQKELTDRILASTPNAVLVVDKGGRLVLANRAFYEFFPVKSDEAEGRPLAEILPIAGLPEAIAETTDSKKPQLSLEFKYKAASGEKILVSQITPMWQGEEVLVILRDVTLERAMQEQLYHTAALASIGELAAGVAHEVNNPLTSILGFSELLLAADLPEEAKKQLTIIQGNAQRAAKVVRNLLTFARRHPPEKRALNLNEVIQHELEMRSYQLRVSNIQVITELAPGLPSVMADLQQFEQVFLNIITNAEQAMREAHGGGTLTVKSEVRGDKIRLSLADDGPGILRENLNRIFDPFFTTKGPGKGTGLGLSICHGIVTEHGGRIYAESEVGKGATFFVELPLKEK